MVTPPLDFPLTCFGALQVLTAGGDVCSHCLQTLVLLVRSADPGCV
jgi:hypothetical protein